MRPYSSPLAYVMNISSPFIFNRTGKLEALSSTWIHNATSLNDYELIVVTKGTLYLQFQDIKYTVTSNQYLLLQPAVEGNTANDKKSRKGFRESECSFYWLHFSGSRIAPTNQLFPSLDTGRDELIVPVHKTLIYPERILLLMRQLQNNVRSSYDNHYSDYMTTLILCELANQHLLSSAKSNAPNQKQLYYDIVDYVNYFININLKTSDVANHFGYNEKYLSRYFKEVSNISLKQYILERKIERANFLLNDTNLTISNISDSLGFSNYHNFVRTYKKVTSMTPSDYRNTYAKRIINHD